MPRRVLLLALAVSLTAGTAAVAAAPRRAPRPTVVVAVPDSGINPYHEAFYRPKNTAHPCTYVAGFSCDVPALRLSVGKHTDYAKAVAADQKLWDSVEPHQWYWIPKTNIIGAVCESHFGTATQTGDDTPTCILDDYGHGTGTAYSVLSEEPDALLLVHEGSSSAADLATAPVIPDIHSHSWGPYAPLPLHAAEFAVKGAGNDCYLPERHPESVFFQAAGNEAPFPTILDCERVAPDVNVVGGGYPGHWTFASWSMFDFASWFCRPVALHTATKGVEDTCGTSFSAPTAAGTAAAALLRLRRQDGYTGRSTTQRVSRTVTRAAFDQALRDGASYKPKSKYKSGELCTEYVFCTAETAIYGARTPMPEQAAHVFWGYGWLDSTVTDAVVNCARGRSCPKKSAEATQWNETRRAAATAHRQQSLVTPAAQDDAGSKRDAGEDRRGAIRIAPGRTYKGMVEPYGGRVGDGEDWYTFRAKAGQKITVKGSASLHPSLPADVSPAVGCWTLHDADGVLVHGETDTPSLFVYGCSTAGGSAPPKDVVAPDTGTYVLVYSAHLSLPKHDYSFSLTVGK